MNPRLQSDATSNLVGEFSVCNTAEDRRRQSLRSPCDRKPSARGIGTELHWSTERVLGKIEPLESRALTEKRGEKHPRTIEAIQRLTQYYEARKKPAETKHYSVLISES